MNFHASGRRALLLSLLLPAAPSFAGVETFVMAVGGQSQLGPNFQCATFGPATAGLGFFANVSVGLPTDGLTTCGVAGGFRTTTAAKGPLSDSTSVSTSFNPPPSNTVTADAAANAVSGKVGASAHAAFTGPVNSLLVEGATSYGVFTETLRLESPTVVKATSGSVRLAFTIDGSMSVAGTPSNGIADVEVNYQLGGGSDFILLRSQINGSAGSPFLAAGTGAPVTGFTLAPGSLSGKATVATFDLPINWSVDTELKFGILASALPGSNGTAMVDFLNSVTLTGITAFANGQQITDFDVVTGSGAKYTAQGVQLEPVPLPASGALLVSAWASTLLLRRRFRRQV